MSDTIHIVIAKYDYEGYDVIKAFKKESSALGLLQEIDKYEEGRLQCPEIDDPDKAWTEFYKWQERFKNGHPAGAIFESADDYVMFKIELED